MSGQCASTCRGSPLQYHRLRSKERFATLMGTISSFGSFSPKADMKYPTCQPPTRRVTLDTSTLPARQQARFAACRQIPVGCLAEDTAETSTCMSGSLTWIKASSWQGADRDRERGFLAHHEYCGTAALGRAMANIVISHRGKHNLMTILILARLQHVPPKISLAPSV